MIASSSRIAIFRALYLGDFLLAVPAFRAIRRQFPEAEITLIGLPWARTLVHRFGQYLDRFVAFPGYPGIDELPGCPERTARFVEEQRAHRYDLAIQMHGSGRTSNALVLDLGATVTAGYYERDRPGRLTLGLPYPKWESEVLRNLHLAQLLGCEDLDPTLEFPLYVEDRREARWLLDKDRSSASEHPTLPLIGIHAGSKLPDRRWPATSFAALGDALVERLGARVVLTGGRNEEDLVRSIERTMRFVPLNLTGRTSLGALGGVLERLDLFVSNDTGPAHLAEAVGTRTVRLYLVSDPDRWGALDRASHAVICTPATDHPFPSALPPERVLEAAERLLTTDAVACDA